MRPLTAQQKKELAKLGIVLREGREGDEEMPSTVSYAGSSARSDDDDDFELEVEDC